MVLEAGGRPVRNPRDLASAVAEAKPGATVALAVSRDGQRAEQRVTLGEVPGTPTAAAAGRNAGGQAAEKGALGLALAPRPDAAPGEGGAVVARVEPGSAADKRGVRQGDVVLRAGDRAVGKPGDVVEAVDAARKAGRSNVALLVERNGDRLFVALPLAPPPTAG